MSLPVVFSLIFYLAFSVYVILIMLLLHISIKSTLHWVLLLSCLMLCIWTFSFCIANSAPDYETSLFWRRAASFGWGTFFSFLLHFTLLLTGHDKLMRKNWVYLVIYVPALMNIFVFGIIDRMAVHQFRLIETYAGWINANRHNFWDWFYNLYYSGFSLTIMILLLRWGVSSKETLRRKQARMLFNSFILVLVAGTLTEFVINYSGTVRVPQVAPILAMIPVTCMCYCIKRYGLILPDKCRIAGEGQILSEATRSRLFQYLVFVYNLGALISFFSLYFYIGKPMREVLAFSGILLMGGILLQLVQNLKTETRYKDILSYSILTISIPMVLLRLMDYAPLYAWVVPIILIIFSIAFNHKQMLSLIGAATLVTLVLIWIRRPETTISFGDSDHLIRIIVLAVILWIGNYINKIYLARLAENEEQVKLQKLLSGISAMFVTVNENNIDDMINQMLQLCGEHFQADRTYLMLSEEHKGIRRFYRWANTGIELSGPSTEEEGNIGLPSFLSPEQLLRKGSIYISVEDIRSEGSQERQWIESRQVKSMLLLPLRNKDSVRGFWSFETTRTPRSYSPEQLGTLKILSNLLADICYKIEVEKEISYRAYYDTLTGLPNRDLFRSKLERAILEAEQSGRMVGVVFIDIDSFKLINDTIGHEGGDSLLVQLGNRLSSVLKPEDTISRFGGDEFLLLISQVQQVVEIITEANKIMEIIKQPIPVGSQEFFVTVSAGISIYPFDGVNATDLIKHSDMAMYVSKQRGKNNFTLCSEEMKKKVVVSMDLTNSLYRALDKNELQVYYQPQISIDTEEITGMEALLRWKHPEIGLILPKDFIHVAEKTGLIHPIGQWILETACRQNKEWQEQGMKPVKIAVNLSIAQFRNPNLIDIIKNILKETGLSPACLELEITESIAVNEAEDTLNTLHELKELGISISIDDFGTEYSSLSRIKDLPVDKIKIDGQFIRGISHSNKDEGIIRVMIQLGKNLGLNILAEGVETEQQLDFLKENQCEQVQGYYYYHPMPSDELEALLRMRQYLPHHD